MLFKDIYEIAVKKGMEKDPRTKQELKDALIKVKKQYNKLSKSDKALFDKEKLRHPFDDTRILYGDVNTDVKSILVGVDMEVGELLVADRLREKGVEVDLVIAHHPEGKALANFYNVMNVQSNILNKMGLKKEIAEELLKERLQEVERNISGINHTRAVDVARLLDIPFMCIHTPADNHVTKYLQNILDLKKPKTLKDVLNILKQVPEYKDSSGKNAPPHILIGDEKKKAGKVLVDMTGGTEGSKKVFSRLSQAGVDTLVCMHLSEEHYKLAKQEYINVIIAGHISSDNIGLNLVIDELIKKDKEIKIIPCSGFVRIKR